MAAFALFALLLHDLVATFGHLLAKYNIFFKHSNRTGQFF